jgi:DNA repair photolyase
MPIEAQRNLTDQALQVIAEYRFPVHIITKSDLVLRDLDTLREINQVYAAVTFTITTADDQLGKKIEPGAPSVTARFRAMQILAENGVLTGVTLMPVLPFLEDNMENIRQIVTRAHKAGASYIIPSFGMTLRDRQREYYYQKLDLLFPRLRREYAKEFGNQYRVLVRNAKELEKEFHELCRRFGIATRITQYQTERGLQIPLFKEHH